MGSGHTGCVHHVTESPNALMLVPRTQNAPSKSGGRCVPIHARTRKRRTSKTLILAHRDSPVNSIQERLQCADVSPCGWRVIAKSVVAARSSRSGPIGRRAFPTIRGAENSVANQRRASPAWASVQAGGPFVSGPEVGLPLPVSSGRNGPRLRRSPYPRRGAFQVSWPRSCGQHLPRHRAFDL